MQTTSSLSNTFYKKVFFFFFTKFTKINVLEDNVDLYGTLFRNRIVFRFKYAIVAGNETASFIATDTLSVCVIVDFVKKRKPAAVCGLEVVVSNVPITICPQKIINLKREKRKNLKSIKIFLWNASFLSFLFFFIRVIRSKFIKRIFSFFH